MLPDPSQFASRNGYYQTALHEAGHSTGHHDRMNRDTLKEGMAAGFGSPEYAREELRAEISAMMTGEQVGVGHDPQRGAAYVFVNDVLIPVFIDGFLILTDRVRPLEG